MPVGEAQALRREAVEVRRGDFAALRVVALHIAVAEVVGEDEEQVRALRGRGHGCGVRRGREREQRQGEQEEVFHGT